MSSFAVFIIYFSHRMGITVTIQHPVFPPPTDILFFLSPTLKGIIDTSQYYDKCFLTSREWISAQTRFV